MRRQNPRDLEGHRETPIIWTSQWSEISIGAMTEFPVLYSFRRCPYAMRARMALASSGQLVELREILLRDKPADMINASPKATVPVLVMDDATVLEESLDIMLWALDRNDPDQWLKPEAGNIDDMLGLISFMDGEFKHHLDNYKYASRKAGPEDDIETFAHHHRQKGLDILNSLEHSLQSRGFLFGDRISLADVAIAPFVRQFANTDADWFGQQSCPNLQSWLTGFLESQLFLSVMEKRKPWQPGDAICTFPRLAA
ncbi:MAG: glutathione S-transferase [Rhizobiaceae bacterium]